MITTLNVRPPSMIMGLLLQGRHQAHDHGRPAFAWVTCVTPGARSTPGPAVAGSRPAAAGSVWRSRAPGPAVAGPRHDRLAEADPAVIGRYPGMREHPESRLLQPVDHVAEQQ